MEYKDVVSVAKVLEMDKLQYKDNELFVETKYETMFYSLLLFYYFCILSYFVPFSVIILYFNILHEWCNYDVMVANYFFQRTILEEAKLKEKEIER